MKKFLLVLFAFISINTFAQINVKEGSFHKIDGYLMLDKEDHRDDNWKPMALIKISTEGMKAEERARLIFHGNMETYIDVKQMEAETYLYLSAQAATFIEIKHPDYGKTEYWFPEDLCDYCGYEMVVQYVNNNVTSNTYISVDTDPSGAEIYIDGKHYGQTPNIITDLPMGKHEIKLEKQEYNPMTKIFIIEEGEKLRFNETLLSVYYKASVVNEDKNEDKKEVVVVEKSKPEKKEKPIEKPKKEKTVKDIPNINFLTLNAAYSIAPQMSFGLTYGQVKKVGWYVSAMSNFGTRFSANPWSDLLYIDEAIASGNSSNTRLSLTGGLLCRLFGPVYMKVGAGYGTRVKCWELNDTWYEYANNSYKGIDLTAGLMFNVKNCVISADVVTTDFEYMEVKIGIGLNWNK